MVRLYIFFADGTVKESPILFKNEFEAMEELNAWEDGEGVGQDYFEEIINWDFEFDDDEDEEE